jgi:hypothetical protein
MREHVVRFLVVALWLAAAAAAAIPGAEYYLLSPIDRPFSELHELYKPSGLLGHGFGILGSLMMLVGVVSYSGRKRIKGLTRIWSLQSWLRFHIFLCTLGPFLVLLHTTFRFGGIVSIAFWSMTLVTLSGVFGRYVYARIPRSINGQFVSLKRIQQQFDTIVERIQDVVDLNASEVAESLGFGERVPAAGLLPAIAAAVTYDFKRRQVAPRLRGMLQERQVPARIHPEIIDLVQQQVRLRHQLVILGPFQRLFRYWHVFHLPMAILMLLIMVVHVFVAVLFGYTWIW